MVMVQYIEIKVVFKYYKKYTSVYRVDQSVFAICDKCKVGRET